MVIVEGLSFRKISWGAACRMEWRQVISGTRGAGNSIAMRGSSKMSDFPSPIPYASDGESKRWSQFVHN